MGFAKEEALNQIDASLDEFIRLENRKELTEEEISEDLYERYRLDFVLVGRKKWKIVTVIFASHRQSFLTGIVFLFAYFSNS